MVPSTPRGPQWFSYSWQVNWARSWNIPLGIGMKLRHGHARDSSHILKYCMSACSVVLDVRLPLWHHNIISLADCLKDQKVTDRAGTQVQLPADAHHVMASGLSEWAERRRDRERQRGQEDLASHDDAWKECGTQLKLSTMQTALPAANSQTYHFANSTAAFGIQDRRCRHALKLQL